MPDRQHVVQLCKSEHGLYVFIDSSTLKQLELAPSYRWSERGVPPILRLVCPSYVSAATQKSVAPRGTSHPPDLHPLPRRTPLCLSIYQVIPSAPSPQKDRGTAPHHIKAIFSPLPNPDPNSEHDITMGIVKWAQPIRPRRD